MPKASCLAPVLISLPDGLSVSGVTLWALRLAEGLAARGHRVTLAVHAEPPLQSPVAGTGSVAFEVLDVRSLPPLRDAQGDLSPFLPRYRDAILSMSRSAGAPCVYIPTLLGDACGIGAAISAVHPEAIRIIGWQHADIAYDRRVLTHYERSIASFVGVSEHITRTLRAELPARRAEITRIPNAVPCSDAPPERTPARARALRLVYTGRLELKQKRCDALLGMSDELAARGVEHTVTLVGDGPAAAQLRLACTGDRATRVLFTGSQTPEHVNRILREADIFVLASRYEGLSVSMLEAMAAGCVPIVTSVASGAAEAISDGVEGVLVDTEDNHAARHMADAVQRALRIGLARLSRQAWARARRDFSPEACADSASEVVQRAAASPARPWPTSLPASFTGTGAGASGTVPHNAAARMRAVLDALPGRRVALHGSGRHTIELAPVLAASPAEIVAITDDDPGRWGTALLGWPIISPARAGDTEITDVIISSFIHADEIYERRSVYERQGIRVHHLYRDGVPHDPPYTHAACTN